MELDAKLLTLPTETARDIALPSAGNFGTIITWTTSDESVLDGSGIVGQVRSQVEVDLTATVAKGGVSRQKTFRVVVLPDDGSLQADAATLEGIADRFSFRKNVLDGSALQITEDLKLIRSYDLGDAGRCGGVNIAWNSSRPEVISEQGAVTPRREDTAVELRRRSMRSILQRRMSVRRSR